MNHYIATTTLLERLVDWRESIHRHGPEHFDMSSWGYSVEGAETYDLGLDYVHALDITACGSTACAAGHFVCISGLTVWQVPDRLGIEEYVAQVLDVPEVLFDRLSWYAIELGDETLLDRFNTYEAEHGDTSLAEWMAVLDYLDQRIKAAMEAAS